MFLTESGIYFFHRLRQGLPIGLIVGVSIAILLVIIVVIVIAVLIRNYYKHDLHKLPIEISMFFAFLTAYSFSDSDSVAWSFLNKLSHPWLWEYRGNKNSHYYIRCVTAIAIAI